MEKYYSVNQNGCSIRCKLYCTDRGVREVLLYGHGFGGSKETPAAQKLAERMHKRHPETALVTFDLPCHGEDASAKLTLGGCMTYLGAVIDDAKTRFQTERLCGCATSFGGYLFLTYLAKYGDPFRSLALRCPAIPMYEVLTQRVITERQLALLQKGKPVPVGFERPVKVTKDFLEELRSGDLFGMDFRAFSDSIVILHGTNDELIPFDAVERFAEKNEIPFFPVEGADHTFHAPKRMDEAIEIILASLF